VAKSNGQGVLEQYIVGPGGEQLTELDTADVTTDNPSGWAHTNVYAAGKLIATFDSAGLHYHFDDPLGSRRAQASASGALEAVYQSLPFGDGYNWAGNGSSSSVDADDPTENHFTGKERDTESGNDYFGARYYASTMGRMLSPDWSETPDTVPYAEFENPQTLNLYSYGNNNPVTYNDPDGHSVRICTDNGNGGTQCNTVDNPTYTQAAGGDNGGLNVPSEREVEANGGGFITDSSGNVVGVLTYIVDGGLDGPQNLAGISTLSNTYKFVNTATAIYGGVYAGAVACAAYCPAAATAAVGLFHTGLRAGMVIGGYVLTTHAAEQAERFGVSEEEIEEAVSGVAKGNPNPDRAWDSVQRFYTATCEVRVNKISGTIVTVINKITR
jgi:RHS repeat-associated protein